MGLFDASFFHLVTQHLLSTCYLPALLGWLLKRLWLVAIYVDAGPPACKTDISVVFLLCLGEGPELSHCCVSLLLSLQLSQDLREVQPSFSIKVSHLWVKMPKQTNKNCGILYLCLRKWWFNKKCHCLLIFIHNKNMIKNIWLMWNNKKFIAK